MIRLALRVRRDQAELVLAELIELAPGGVEEVDVSDEVVEYAVYGSPGELPDLPDVRAAAGGALVEVSASEVADDWAERWRDFHRPLVLPGLVVRPPWIASDVSPTGETRNVDGVDIVIDPGRAFGTGAHATTRLCLELLLDLAPRGEVVDLGCGSGVLGIVAAKLGCSPVLALDFDPLAVEATRENAVVNGVADVIDVRRFDLRTASVPGSPLVLANLLAPLLFIWCSQLASGMAQRPGAVIASGLLVGAADGIADAFAAVGLHEIRRRELGEWAALLLRAGETG